MAEQQREKGEPVRKHRAKGAVSFQSQPGVATVSCAFSLRRNLFDVRGVIL